MAEANLVVLGGPRTPFTGQELKEIRQYIEAGGSVLVMMNEGGESKTAADACSRRQFHPGSRQYADGWQSALDCARLRGGSADEAVEACATGV